MCVVFHSKTLVSFKFVYFSIVTNTWYRLILTDASVRIQDAAFNSDLKELYSLCVTPFRISIIFFKNKKIAIRF